MHGNDDAGVAARDRHRPPWPATALLALVVLAGWPRVARNRVPPILITLSFGVWLLLAPSMWEFADGVDAWPRVPIPPSDVTEPTRAMAVRAEWNSILAGLLTLALSGSLLLAARRRKRRAASAGRGHRQQVEAPDGRR